MPLAALLWWPIVVVGGMPSTGDDAVVAIVERSLSCPSVPPRLVCTGTALAGRVVLTAAHCVRDLDPAALDVIAGPDLTGSAQRVLAARVHPAYAAGDASADLAVLVLEAPLTYVAASGPFTSSTGSSVRIVGYGATVADATSAGIKHTGSAEVSAVTATMVSTVLGPALTCHGDSGGPVLAGNDELVAVTSTGDPGCALDSQAVRVDAHATWLADAAAVTPPPARPAFDPDANLCERPCASDDECASGLACRGTCTIAGLPAGRLGASCGDDADGPCVAAPDGCRRFSPCEPGGDSGCNTGGRSGWATLAVVAFLAVITRRGFRRP